MDSPLIFKTQIFMKVNEAKLLGTLTKQQTSRKSLPVIVSRYYTDVNGTIIDKNNAGIAAAGLNISFPVYVFNEYDRRGGLFYANMNLPPKNAAKFLCTFIWGVNNPFFFGFTGLSDIQLRINPGDICTVYTDNLIAPTYFVWIVQSSRLISLAAVVADLGEHSHHTIPYMEKGIEKTYFETVEFRYFSSNAKQWQAPIQVFGTNKSGTFQLGNYLNAAGMYRKPITVNDQMVKVDVKLQLNQYIGIYTTILFATDSFEWDFTIKM